MMDKATEKILSHLDEIGWENWTEEDWDIFLAIKEKEDER